MLTSLEQKQHHNINKKGLNMVLYVLWQNKMVSAFRSLAPFPIMGLR